MNITKRFMTKNRCYTNSIKIKPTKLVLHSLGVAQPNANALINSWDNQTTEKCVHAFIMEHEVVQTLPWDYKAWHVGTGSKGSYNACAIGVELCEPSGHKYNGGAMVGYDVAKNKDYFAAVYNNAVELFAYLCKEYGLDPLKDIVCHSEVYALGYGSNHSDVMQWFPKHGKSMDTFRNDVKTEMNYIPAAPITKTSGEKAIYWLQEKINKANPSYTIPLTGKYDSKTRIAVLSYAEAQGWNWDNATGWQVGAGTINTLSKP
jgi:N-acetylmuramoyl-L-alanine amidase